MRWFARLLLAVLLLVARPDDTRLSELRAMLVPMRKIPAPHLVLRGVTPELTVIKHTLGDWVEARMAALT